LESAGQSLWKLRKRMIRDRCLSLHLRLPGVLALCDIEKAEALADSLETKFESVNDPSLPAFIVAVDEALRTYEYAPATEPKLSRF
jgi:hypothetical protein